MVSGGGRAFDVHRRRHRCHPLPAVVTVVSGAVARQAHNMLSHTTITRSSLAVGLVVVFAGIAQSTRSMSAGGGHSVRSLSSPTVSPGAASHAGSTALDSALVVQAAATITRFCRLVDQGRYRRASSLLAAARVWPLRRLRRLCRFRFVVARLAAHPRNASLTFRTRLLVACTPRTPRAARRDCLYFTLGRDGTTGDWLITAVGTHP